MLSPDEARRVIEAAALGMSGAARTRDMPYATQRHEQLLTAGHALAGLDYATYCLKVGRLLLTCARGDAAAAERLVTEIRYLIALCP